MATVAKLNVQIGAELSGLQKSLKSAQASLESFGRSASAIGSSMSTFITAPIVGGLGLAVKAASDAEETFSKFATVFRDVGGEAEDAFQTLRKEYGLSAKASKQLLGDTGDLLTGFGFTQDEALKLSTEVQKLAVDLASFSNFSGGAEGASKALTSALLGEREAVKSLQIVITEEAVKKQMAINATKGLTFATEQQAKAQATFDIAIQQSQNAIGDYARTQDSFANQLKNLQRDLSDLTVTIGTRLLPFAQKLVNAASNLVKSFQSMSSEVVDGVIKFGLFVAALGPLLTGLGFVSIAFSALSAPIVGAVAAITLASVSIIRNWDKIVQYFTSGKGAQIWSDLKSIIEQTGQAITSIWNTFGEDFLRISEITFVSAVKGIEIALSGLNKVMQKFNGDFEDELNIFEDNILTTLSKIDSKLTGFTFDFGAFLYDKLVQQPLQVLGVLETEFQRSANRAAKGLANARQTLKDAIGTDPIFDPKIVFGEEFNFRFDSINLSESMKPKLSVEFDEVAWAGVTTRVRDELTNIEDILSFDYNVPEKMFPPGSIGFMTQRIQYLNEQMQWATSAEEVAVFTAEIDRLQKKIDELGGSYNQTGQQMVDMTHNLESTISSGFASIAETIGNAFTGDLGTKSFFETMMLIVADFSAQFGKALIAAGVAALAFQQLLINPVAAIAAGAALVGLSAVVRNIIKKGPTQRVNDALITSSGKVIEFSPKDNILAMQDMGSLGSGGSKDTDYTFIKSLVDISKKILFAVMPLNATLRNTDSGINSIAQNTSGGMQTNVNVNPTDVIVNPPNIIVNPPDIVVNPPDIIVNPPDIVVENTFNIPGLDGLLAIPTAINELGGAITEFSNRLLTNPINTMPEVANINVQVSGQLVGDGTTLYAVIKNVERSYR
jgi:hypothetical protein